MRPTIFKTISFRNVTNFNDEEVTTLRMFIRKNQEKFFKIIAIVNNIKTKTEIETFFVALNDKINTRFNNNGISMKCAFNGLRKKNIQINFCRLMQRKQWFILQLVL